MEPEDPSTLAHEYVRLQARIEELEEQASLVKTNLWDALRAGEVVSEETKTWDFADVRVSLMPKSFSERIDRSKLAQLGVSRNIIEQATVKSERKAHLRIAEVVQK